MQKFNYVNNIINSSTNLKDWSILFFKFFINYINFSLFLYLINIIYKSKFKILSYLLILLLTSIFIGILISRTLYESSLNLIILENILNTNTNEILSMVKILVPFIFIFLVIFFIFFYIIKNIKSNYTIISILISLSIINLGFNYLYYRYTNKQMYETDSFEYRFNLLNDSDPLFIMNDLFNLYNYNNLIEEINLKEPIFNFKKINEGYDNIVLIIGESSTRENMSLYNYNLPTTPNQDEEKENMIIYKNSYSSTPYTLSSLKHMLTVSGQKYETTKLEDYSNNIIRIANEVGYETIWISTQNQKGIYNNLTSIIASNSSKQFWLKGYDEEVLKPFYNVINSNKNKKLIIIHINGSHTSAKDRYPEKFNKFKNDKKGVNEYNNSIYYTDFVIGEIFKILRTYEKSIIIYTSDHGQEYNESIDTYTHSNKVNGFKVPLWIWNKNLKSSIRKDFIQNTEIFNLTKEYLGIDNNFYQNKIYKFCISKDNDYVNFSSIPK